MAVKFPQKINPTRKLKIRFDYAPRALQYLIFFGLIKNKFAYSTNDIEKDEHSFMGVKFDDYNDCKKFLEDNRIIYDEVDVSSYGGDEVVKEYTVVDCKRLYELMEDQPTDIIKHKLYSVNELCNLLSFSRPVIYKLINSGELKSIHVNNKIRVKHQDYLNYINNSN